MKIIKSVQQHRAKLILQNPNSAANPNLSTQKQHYLLRTIIDR
jgi:hypothetical protein